jgi:rod shape-determining protein MreB and related proteins
MRLRPGVAIDLGTVNTLVSVSGRGIVVDEPSAIAVDRATGTATAVGRAADAMTGKEPRDVEVVHPLQDGVIADLDAASLMLQAFFSQARLRRLAFRPVAAVCVPSGATAIERRALAAAVRSRRPQCDIRLIDEPVAAAAGAGFDLTGGPGAFIVDIGGGTTDIAMISGGGLSRGETLRIGGNAMDEAIVRAVKADLGLLIGRNAARQLKITVGIGDGGQDWAQAAGVDMTTRIPREVKVPGDLIATALEKPVAAIVTAVREILTDLPPDLAEDVVHGKICLAGGGALLPGLAARIEQATGLPVIVADDPLRCVVRGAAEIVERWSQGGSWHEPAPGGYQETTQQMAVDQDER